MLDFIDSIEASCESYAGSLRTPNPITLGQKVIQSNDSLARCEQLSGLTLTVIDPVEKRFASGLAMLLGDGRLVPELVDGLHRSSVQVLYDRNQGVWLYGLNIPGTDLQAGGILLRRSDQIPETIRRAAELAGISDATLQAWAEKHSGIRPELVIRLLQSAHDLMQHERITAQSNRNTSSVVGQLGLVYEEVILLQDLAQYLRPDIDPRSLAEAVLERVRLICETDFSAICLRNEGHSTYQMDGDWDLTGPEIEALVLELLGSREPQIIVRNHIDTSPLQSRFPTVRSLVAVPLTVEGVESGWLILANPPEDRELGSEQANLLKSISGVLSGHIHLVDLFREQEEMLLSFIRSLVSTLDAKDSYTRGHSERVALVAQRIARELQLPDEEVEAIYQSGLLHDIGKIGLDDAVLRKADSLSTLEFSKVAKHPEVGYAILSELKSFSHLLPGVMHHHERYDGHGYPSKLVGLAIPRMARILAVADAFDAMGSDRPYRRGMDREKVELILAKGSGTQWDPEVVHAFFSARTDIYRIWEKAIAQQLPSTEPMVHTL